MRETKIAPALIVSAAQKLLRTEWTAPPQWIDPPRNVDLSNNNESALLTAASWESFVSTGLVPYVLSAAADVIVDFQENRRAVVFCIPVSGATMVLPLLAELLAILPPSRQVVTSAVSHVVELEDAINDAAIVFTYADTPFFEKQLQRHDPRRPLILRTDQPDTLPREARGDYATAILSTWSKGHSQLLAAAHSWDKWNFSPANKRLFPRAVALHNQMCAAISVDDVRLIADSLHKYDMPELNSYVIQWGADMVARLSAPAIMNSGKAIALVALDARWPGAIRDEAFNAACRNPRASIEAMISQGEGDSGSQKWIASHIATRTRQSADHELVDAIIDSAAKRPTLRRLEFIHTLLQSAALDAPQAKRWCRTLAAADESQVSELLRVAADRLCKAPIVAAQLTALFEDAQSPEPNPRFSRRVTIPCLKHLLTKFTATGDWEAAADLFVQHLVRSTDTVFVATELQQLRRLYVTRLSLDQTQRWRDWIKERHSDPAVLCALDSAHDPVELTDAPPIMAQVRISPLSQDEPSIPRLQARRPIAFRRTTSGNHSLLTALSARHLMVAAFCCACLMAAVGWKMAPSHTFPPKTMAELRSSPPLFIVSMAIVAVAAVTLISSVFTLLGSYMDWVLFAIVSRWLACLLIIVISAVAIVLSIFAVPRPETKHAEVRHVSRMSRL
jgi:hypothetical protein